MGEESYVNTDTFYSGMRELKDDLMVEVQTYRPLSVRVEMTPFQQWSCVALLAAIIFWLISVALRNFRGDE